MPDGNAAAVAEFIKGTPPGELEIVIADIEWITHEEKYLLEDAKPALVSYNEEQLTTVKLPGGSQKVLVTSYNSLGGGRYYDIESSSSFEYDHSNQKASSVKSYSLDSQHIDLIKSLLKALAAHVTEHYPSATYSVFPTDSDSTLAIVLVANKYSPKNFWNGRWRNVYLYKPSDSLTGTIKVDVHYYEDGNVRMTTNKGVSPSISSSASASDIVRQMALAEKSYQEELNRGFDTLSEGAYKNLRRQLPVTRQKVDWDKISGYRLGQDLGGGRSK
ncbi:F-actin-capping protein subunit alpha [Thelotrema lepadinum]|nr:F-actin-capping protein subunit alpha [Thelotrema lepadinum]